MDNLIIPQTWDLHCNKAGLGVASGLVCDILMGRNVSLPINLPECVAKADVAATAQTVYDIQKNGVSIGSITFAEASTNGTFTFAVGVSLVSGDILKIITPAIPDATLSNVKIVIIGSRG